MCAQCVASKARSLRGIRFFLVVVKFNVPMLKGNDDASFYLSYVLKMARINLFDPIFSPFLA